jgi:predicted Fe-Mo cluster-binding NifX family protein
MKIAAITDDGKSISQHFGRAAYYLVATVENGEIVQRELRDKLGHAHFQNEPHEAAHEAAHEAEAPGQPHGFGPASHDRHVRMGAGAYYSMEQRGIRPVVTDIESIEEALQAYIEGRIIDHTEKLH